MSSKYKVGEDAIAHFVTFAVVGWVDVFSRECYKEIFVNSLKYCQENKGLKLHAWVIMTNHVHLIVSSDTNKIENLVRDIKKYSSKQIIAAIQESKTESRKEWMLWLMERAAKKTSNDAKFQLWQPENHPIELSTQKIAWQKLDYIHYNPIEAGFVKKSSDWLYSSAVDYNGGKGLLDIMLLDPMII